MNIAVRKAEIEDFEDFSRIMNQVQELHVKWRPDIYRTNKEPVPFERYTESLEEDIYYVGEAEGKMVGVLGLITRHIETPAHVTRDVLFIDSMAVDEPYRGMGVGHAFFEFVQDLAKHKNCDGIELQVNARNKRAYEMYKKCGFREKSINMELDSRRDAE